MKHAFDRFIHYLQKNYFSYWVELGIDTFIALLCTWVSFIGIHYITETSKEIVSLFHILAVSAPVFLKYDQRHGDNIESEWIA